MSVNLVSAEQLAEQLGVAKSTVYALARRRQVPFVKVGDRVLFNPEKVISALEIKAESD